MKRRFFHGHAIVIGLVWFSLEFRIAQRWGLGTSTYSETSFANYQALIGCIWVEFQKNIYIARPYVRVF